MTRWLRLAVTVAICSTGVTASSAAASLSTASPSTASPSTATPAAAGCRGRAGVTVVVDPGPLGGAADSRCVPDGAGGLAAELIAEAGFSITYAVGQPFVCRIDGRPAAAREDCANTPPGNAYWGLFWAGDRAGEWTYSTLGAAGLEVPEGGAVGLRFQDGGEREDPGVPPRGQSTPGDPVEASTDGDPVPPADQAPPPDGPWLTLTAGALVVVLLAAALLTASRRRR